MSRTLFIVSQIASDFVWIFDRCDAHWSNLDNSDAGRRAHRHTEALFEAVRKKSLWDDYGIISDILVCHSSYYLNTTSS